VKPRQIQIIDGALISGEARLTLKKPSSDASAKGAGGEMIGRGRGGDRKSPTHKLPCFGKSAWELPKVGIDHETGEVKLKKFISVADVGKAIHPEHCIAQEEGAAMQGIGHTFFRAVNLRQWTVDQSQFGRLPHSNFRRRTEEFHHRYSSRTAMAPALRRARYGRGRHSFCRAVGVQCHRPRHQLCASKIYR